MLAIFGSLDVVRKGKQMAGALIHPPFTLHTSKTITACVNKINLLLCPFIHGLGKKKKDNNKTAFSLFIASVQIFQYIQYMILVTLNSHKLCT